MAYVGNLSCRNCGLTFTARWGSYDGVDEYRCRNDHVVHASVEAGTILAVDGQPADGSTLAEARGRCPACGTELATGRLPMCPVCSGRDHEVRLEGLLG